MGIFNSTSSSEHHAERLVVFRDDGAATDVKLVVDPTLPVGMMRVESSLRRLSGVSESCVVERNGILVVRIAKRGSRSGRIGASSALPASVSYKNLAYRGKEDIWLKDGHTSLVTIRTANPDQLYVVNPF